MQESTQSGVVWQAPQGLLRSEPAVVGQHNANVAICPDPRGGAVVTAGWGDESGLDLWTGQPHAVAHAVSVAAEPGDDGVTLPDWSLPEAARHASPIHSHLQPVVDAAMAVRAARMVVAAGRTLHLYDFPTPGSGFVHAGALEGHPDAVVRTGISADGLRALAALPSGEVWLWDVSHMQLLHRLTQSQQPFWTGFLWNDLLVGVGDGSGRVVLWEAASGRRHMQFDAHTGTVLGVSASSERGALLTYGADGVARQWDLDEGRQLSRDIVHAAPICAARFAGGGKLILTLDDAGRLAVTSSADGSLLDWLQLAPAVGGRLAVDRRSGAIWVGSEQGLTRVVADWPALLALRPSLRQSGRFAPIVSSSPMRPAKSTVRVEPGQTVAVPPKPAPAAAEAPAPARVAPPVQPPAPPVMLGESAARLPSSPSHEGAAWQPAEPDRFRTGADSIIGMAPIPLLGAGARLISSGNQPVIAPVADLAVPSPAPAFRPPPPVAHRPAVAPQDKAPSTGSARREPAPSSIVDQIRASQIIWQESARRSRTEVRNTVLIAIFAGLVAAAVTGHHFTYRAMPAAIQAEMDRNEQTQQQTVAQANAEFERYQSEQRAVAARYRDDTTLLPTEQDRLQRIAERRIEDRRARRDQAVLEGQARLQVAQADLVLKRAALAKRLALTGGLIIAAAAALVAFLVQLSTREKPVSRFRAGRR